MTKENSISDARKTTRQLNEFVNGMIIAVDILYDNVKDLPIEYWSKGNIVDNRNELQYCLSSINDISRYLSDARKAQ